MSTLILPQGEAANQLVQALDHAHAELVERQIRVLHNRFLADLSMIYRTCQSDWRLSKAQVDAALNTLFVEGRVDVMILTARTDPYDWSWGYQPGTCYVQPAGALGPFRDTVCLDHYQPIYLAPPTPSTRATELLPVGHVLEAGEAEQQDQAATATTDGAGSPWPPLTHHQWWALEHYAQSPGWTDPLMALHAGYPDEESFRRERQVLLDLQYLQPYGGPGQAVPSGHALTNLGQRALAHARGELFGPAEGTA